MAGWTLERIVVRQMDASLAMLRECVRNCPPEKWDAAVGTWPFWQVAYHVLCYADLYTARSAKQWEADREGSRGRAPLHPRGREEMRAERPSRRFEPGELERYVGIVRTKVRAAIRAETPKSLGGPSGFSWVPGCRAELYVYNVRHVQHHVGQLTAFLWKHGVKTRWVMAGRT